MHSFVRTVPQGKSNMKQCEMNICIVQSGTGNNPPHLSNILRLTLDSFNF